MLREAGPASIEGDGSQRSTAVGAKVTTSPSGSVVSTTMPEGQVTNGAVVSSTLTSNVHESEFPESSVAVQVTVVVPIGNVLPEGGKDSIVGAGSWSSLAVAVKETAAPPAPVASATWRPGQVTS